MNTRIRHGDENSRLGGIYGLMQAGMQDTKIAYIRECLVRVLVVLIRLCQGFESSWYSDLLQGTIGGTDFYINRLLFTRYKGTGWRNGGRHQRKDQGKAYEKLHI